MAMPIWTLVVIGGLPCVATTWFLHTASFLMHFWMTAPTCSLNPRSLLGLVVFKIAILDNPFRGRAGIGSVPLQLVHRQLVRTPSSGELSIAAPGGSRN